MDAVLTFFADYWRAAIEVIILWFIIYHMFRYFRATRGARIFIALVAIYICMTLLSRVLDLVVIGRLLNYFSVFLAVALVVIFQPELRRALAELGSHPLFNTFSESSRQEFTERLVEISQTLSRRRVGALMAVQRGIDLKQYLETGVELDSRLTPELVSTIFHTGTSLHDGGMIVRMGDERILGAGCVFPLNQSEMSDRSVGLRHRAAMGITEESDALALVVSEETGRVSISVEGKLEMDLSEEDLRGRLNEIFLAEGFDEDEEENEAGEEELEEADEAVIELAKSKNKSKKSDTPNDDRDLAESVS
ncbi:MAG: TIGR00159 family protein [Verrucomicrobiales bacterium]|nr:TIGR00159 family protein [Verrucomicrobiales bacterium]